MIEAHTRLTHKLESYGRRRAAEHQLAEAMDEANYSGLYYPKLDEYVAAMKHCREQGVAGLKHDGRLVIAWKSKCNCLRLCPDEARQDQSRVLKQYFDAILSAKRGWLGAFAITRRGVDYEGEFNPSDVRLYKGVFTMPNVPQGELHAAKRAIFAEFKNFRRKLPEIIGHLVIEEDPLAFDGTWHVHLNVIMLVDGYLDYDRVRLYWPWVLKLASEADMLKATRATLKKRGLKTDEIRDDVLLVAAVKECVKYPVQAVSEKSDKAAGGWVGGEYRDPVGEPCAPPMTEWPVAARAEWWRAQQGFRRVRSYGVLYGLEKPEIPDTLDQDTDWFAVLCRDAESRAWTVTRAWLPWLHSDRIVLLPFIPRGISRRRPPPEEQLETGPPLELRALVLAADAERNYLGEKVWADVQNIRCAEAVAQAIDRELERAA